MTVTWRTGRVLASLVGNHSSFKFNINPHQHSGAGAWVRPDIVWPPESIQQAWMANLHFSISFPLLFPKTAFIHSFFFVRIAYWSVKNDRLRTWGVQTTDVGLLSCCMVISDRSITKWAKGQCFGPNWCSSGRLGTGTNLLTAPRSKILVAVYR